MSRTFKDQVAQINKQIREDLANAEIKQRVTFHRGTDLHGKQGKAKNRYDRRSSRAALRRGDW